MAISRRAYPILGRFNLGLFDATRGPLEPVYIRYEILEAGLRPVRTSLRTSLRTLDLDPGSDPGSGPGSQISQILVIIKNITVKRPYEPINSIYSINKAQSGWLG